MTTLASVMSVLIKGYIALPFVLQLIVSISCVIIGIGLFAVFYDIPEWIEDAVKRWDRSRLNRTNIEKKWWFVVANVICKLILIIIASFVMIFPVQLFLNFGFDSKPKEKPIEKKVIKQNVEFKTDSVTIYLKDGTKVIIVSAKKEKINE